jgi:glyoxylase-like metal-dependent hydrolase (beta-lactamase superfamily II)
MSVVPTPTTLQIGPWTITPVIEAIGPFLVAAAVFPHLDPPQLVALLERHGDRYADPARDRLVVTSQGYLIRSQRRTLLIDTCVGGPKPHRSPPFPGFVSPWLHALAAHGVSPSNVDLVVSTHLHHDHIGWNTTFDPDGTLRPTFDQARYLVAEAEYEHATGLAEATPRGGAAEHIHDSVIPLVEAGRLSLAGPDHVIDDGIRLLAASGHTPGHSIVQISAEGSTALLIGDLLHHPLQIDDPAISAAMCMDPIAAATTRAQILDRAATDQAILLAAHLVAPFRVTARLGAPGYVHHEI